MLPLAHMYGLAFEFLYQLAGGTQIFFLGKLPSPKVLLDSFAKVQPYMVVTVPLALDQLKGAQSINSLRALYADYYGGSAVVELRPADAPTCA